MNEAIRVVKAKLNEALDKNDAKLSEMKKKIVEIQNTIDELVEVSLGNKKNPQPTGWGFFCANYSIKCEMAYKIN